MNRIFEHIKTYIPGMNARIGYELEKRNWVTQEVVTLKSSFPIDEKMTAHDVGVHCRLAVDDIIEQVEDERARRLSCYCRALKVRTDTNETLFTMAVEVEFTDPKGY